MKSIRRQLSKHVLISLFFLFSIFCLLLFLIFQQLLLKDFDKALLHKAQTLASLVEYEIKGEHHGRKRIEFEVEFHEKNLPEFQKGESPEYYRLIGAQGKIIADSQSLEGIALSTEFQTLYNNFDIINVPLPSGKKGRAISYQFFAKVESEEDEHEHEREHGNEHTSFSEMQNQNHPAKKLVLILARPREHMDQSIMALLIALLGLGLLLPLAVIPVINGALNKGLVPLAKIASETESIQPDNLAHRFDCENLPDELKPIASRLNELLDRVETALVREQRFNADVAHELRTPIAELRALSEVGLKNADTENPRPYFEDSLDIALRMEHLSTALLELKRIEAKRYKINPVKIDLTKTINDCWKSFSEKADEKDLKVNFELAQSVEIESDKTLMEAILKNLFSNAVSHSSQGGEISCKLENSSPGFKLTLSNSQNSLCDNDLEHLFEPFWSKDASRTDTHHCGLGLSLLKVYVETLEFRIDVSLVNNSNIAFSLYS